MNLIQQINRYNNDSNPYLIKTNTEDPRYNDHVGYQRFCSKIEFAAIKKPDMDPSKTGITNTMYFFYKSYVLCICYNRLGEAFLTNIQNICFSKE